MLRVRSIAHCGRSANETPCRAIAKHRATKRAAAPLFLNLPLLFCDTRGRIRPPLLPQVLDLVSCARPAILRHVSRTSLSCAGFDHILSAPNHLGPPLDLLRVPALYPYLLRSRHWLHLLEYLYSSLIWMPVAGVARHVLAATDPQAMSKVPFFGKVDDLGRLCPVRGPCNCLPRLGAPYSRQHVVARQRCAW